MKLQQDADLQRLAALQPAHQRNDRALPHELLRLELFGHLQYLPAMADQDITANMLPTLDRDDLKYLGMTVGDLKCFMAAVKLQEDVPPETEPEPEPAVTAQAKFVAFFGRMGDAAWIQGMDATPVSPLRETVTFIAGDGAPSQAQFAAGCTAAEAKADALLNGGPDEYGLTGDEIASIHLNTQDLMYQPLNRALWSAARGAVKPYWGYLRLLQQALFKVPKCSAGTIYRGIKDLCAPITEATMLAKAIESGGSVEPEIWGASRRVPPTRRQRRHSWAKLVYEYFTRSRAGGPRRATSTRTLSIQQRRRCY